MSLERQDRMDQNLLINGLVSPLCQRLPGGVATLTAFFLYQLIDRFMGRFQGNFNTDPTWEVAGDYSLMKGDFSGEGSLEMQQRIESLLAFNAVGMPVSLSLELFSESCNRVTVSLYYPSTQDDWSTEEILIVSKEFEIPVNQDYQLRWENLDLGYNTRNGIQVRVVFHNPQTLNIITEHKIKKIKLSVGEQAQLWSPCGRNLLDDRALCLRYYEIAFGGGFAHWGNGHHTGRIQYQEKRHLPSVSIKERKFSYPDNNFWHIEYTYKDGCKISYNSSVDHQLMWDGTIAVDAEL